MTIEVLLIITTLNDKKLVLANLCYSSSHTSNWWTFNISGSIILKAILHQYFVSPADSLKHFYLYWSKSPFIYHLIAIQWEAKWWNTDNCWRLWCTCYIIASSLPTRTHSPPPNPPQKKQKQNTQRENLFYSWSFYY